VAESFESAVSTYGIPTRVRSDCGGENVDVWRFMLSHYNDESCVTVGSSTHNERIERLWRDVRTSVIQPDILIFITGASAIPPQGNQNKVGSATVLPQKIATS